MRAADDSFAVKPLTAVDRCLDAARAISGRFAGRGSQVPATERRQRRQWLLAGVLAVASIAAGALGPITSTPEAAAGPLVPGAPASDPAGHATITGEAGDAAFVALPGGTIPVGKGMWLNHLARSAGGDVTAIVAQATAARLTHLYVRVGSSVDGFYARPDLERLLPAAHAAGLKVIGWDFVYLGDPRADAFRGRQEAGYTAATGDHLDGLAADIETENEGVHLSAGAARLYGDQLRAAVGPRFPLIAVVPRPNPRLTRYPFADVVADFDAIAPMVYWGHQDPAALVTAAIQALAPYGKPVLPVGQAYDPAIDGGAPGAPTRADISSFISAAAAQGAPGLSFWVWETATADHWAAIAGAGELTLDPAAVQRGDPAAVTYLQHVLSALGHPTIATGTIDQQTADSLAAVQRIGGARTTRTLDAPTAAVILAPR